MLYFGRFGSSWRHCAFFGSSWGKKVITPKKKIGEEDAYFFFFFLLIALQILYVFLPDISVHCPLIAYAYI